MAQDQGLDKHEGHGHGQGLGQGAHHQNPIHRSADHTTAPVISIPVTSSSSSSLPPVSQSTLPPVIEINDDGSVVNSPLPARPAPFSPVSTAGHEAKASTESDATQRDKGSAREKGVGAPLLPPIKPSDEPVLQGPSPAAIGQGLAPRGSGSRSSHRSADKGSDKGSGVKKKTPSQAANRARLVSDVVAKAQGPMTKDPSYALQVTHTPDQHTLNTLSTHIYQLMLYQYTPSQLNPLPIHTIDNTYRR